MFPGTSTSHAPIMVVVAFFLWGLALFFIARRYRLDARDGGVRARRKLVVRILLATALLALFLAPTRTVTLERPSAIFAVVDDSASMTRRLEGRRYDVRTVSETVAAALEEAAVHLDDRVCHVRYLSGAPEFSCDARSPIGRVDELTAPAIPRGFYQAQNEPIAPSAVFLITDGIAKPELTTVSDNKIRVYPMVVGEASQPFNWRIVDLKTVAPDAPGTAASLSATIELADSIAPRGAVVELWRQNKDAAPTRLWTEPIEVASDPEEDGVRRFSFNREWRDDVDDLARLLVVVDRADADAYRLESLLPKASGAPRLTESCAADNAVSFHWKSPMGPLRVLLVDDLPRYEYRYLRETLRREPTVELRTTLLSADLEVVSSDPIALAPDALSRETLARFDVVIVGDLTHDQWQRTLGALRDVLEEDDSSTSLWLAGPERLIQTPRWQEFPETQIFPGDAMLSAAPVDAPDDEWRILLAPASETVYPTLTSSIMSNATADGSRAILPNLTRAFPVIEPGPHSATLLLAERVGAAGASPEPLLLAASLGKNAGLWQATDELWRLQTLADKSVYRSFVLQTLDYLTDPDKRVAAADLSALDEARLADAPGSRDLFAFFSDDSHARRAALRELSDLAASLETPEAIARATGAASIDLRGLAPLDLRDETIRFYKELRESLPVETATEERPVFPGNFLYPLALILFILVILL
ncbi:MAG: hypothetical protein ACOX0A_06050 [Thermoguttaceae bacterium]|jgi:hypothetical protein